jgi:hypothetical protein
MIENKKGFGSVLEKNKNSLYKIILALLCFGVYFKAVNYGMLFDDRLHFIDSPYMQTLSWSNLLHFWKEPFQGMYIPVAYNFWLVINTLGKILRPEYVEHSPAFLHLANVIIHSFNTLLVFILFKRWNLKPIAAFMGAVFFAIHPLQVESVVWISEFRGVLSAFFGLMALIMVDRALDLNRHKWIYLIFATILFGAGLLSKPSAVIFPLMLMVLHFSKIHKDSKNRTAVISTFVVWVLIIVPIYLVTKGEQKDNLIMFVPDMLQRLMLMGDTYGFYISKVLLPLNLAIYDRRPQYVVENLMWFNNTLIFVLTATLVGLLGRRYMFLTKGFLLFIVAVAPISGVITFVYQNWSGTADRYMYMPILGWCYIAAVVIHKSGLVIRVSGFLLASLYLAFAQGYMKNWEDENLFWAYTYSKSPDSPKIMQNYVNVLGASGNKEESLEKLKVLVEKFPDDEQNNLFLSTKFQDYGLLNFFLLHQKFYRIHHQEPSVLLKIFEKASNAHFQLGHYQKAENYLDSIQYIVDTQTGQKGWSLADKYANYAAINMIKAKMSILQGQYRQVISFADSSIKYQPNQIAYELLLQSLDAVQDTLRFQKEKDLARSLYPDLKIYSQGLIQIKQPSSNPNVLTTRLSYSEFAAECANKNYDVVERRLAEPQLSTPKTILSDRARCYLIAKDYQKSVEHYLKFKQSFGLGDNEMSFLAEAYYGAADTLAAIQWLEKSIYKNDRHFNRVLRLVTLYGQIFEFQKVKYYSELLKIIDSSKFEGYYHSAMAEYALQNYLSAKKNLKKALDLGAVVPDEIKMLILDSSHVLN